MPRLDEPRGAQGTPSTPRRLSQDPLLPLGTGVWEPRALSLGSQGWALGAPALSDFCAGKKKYE